MIKLSCKNCNRVLLNEKRKKENVEERKARTHFSFLYNHYSATITFVKVENIYMNETNERHRNNFLSYIFAGVKT